MNFCESRSIELYFKSRRDVDPIRLKLPNCDQKLSNKESGKIASSRK